jgi:hypothetical protein
MPHHVYYQLAILVLFWLCVLLPHLWPSPPSGAPKTPRPSMKPNRRRSSGPKGIGKSKGILAPALPEPTQENVPEASSRHRPAAASRSRCQRLPEHAELRAKAARS